MIRFASFLPLWVLFAAASGSTYTACDDCTDIANTSVLAAMKLVLYTSVDDYTSVLVGDAASLYDKLDSSLPTVLYISGWTESPSSESVQDVLAAYFSLGQHNVLIANWSEVASQEYTYSAGSVNGVGYIFASALDELVEAGMDSTTLHVVGHSLGAQISGYIGRYTSFTLPRITGLDPAGPDFAITDAHLSSTDATYVDAIHTDPGIFGVNYSAATADFWPNGRSGIQPGTESDNLIITYASSHARSWKYFVESLTDEDAFIAIPCDSWYLFEEGTCGSSSDDEVVMGNAAPTTISGNYYLQTNNASLYGRGTAGATYEA